MNICFKVNGIWKTQLTAEVKCVELFHNNLPEAAIVRPIPVQPEPKNPGACGITTLALPGDWAKSVISWCGILHSSIPPIKVLTHPQNWTDPPHSAGVSGRFLCFGVTWRYVKLHTCTCHVFHNMIDVDQMVSILHENNQTFSVPEEQDWFTVQRWDAEGATWTCGASVDREQ